MCICWCVNVKYFIESSVSVFGIQDLVMIFTELLLTFALLDSIQTTVSFKYHGDVCSDTPSCEIDTSCVLSVDNKTRCLCSDDEYRSDRNQCVNIYTLLIQDVRTVKVTLNSVKLSWSSQNVNYKNAKYNVSYEYIYTLGDEYGITIYNLKSDTNYKFTIQVILFKNQLYKARYGLPITHFVRTMLKQDSKKSHGELCNKGVDSCPNEFLCVQNKNQEDRCLCDHNHYWNDHNECISMSALTIRKFTAINIYSTSVELSWSTDSLNKTSAQFKVWYRNGNNTLFHRDVRLATIDELKPETFYTFTIKVEIPADENYPLIEGPTSMCVIQTTIQFLGHGEFCELANSPCEPGTSCVETPNKQYRCLCNETQYWNKNRICVPLTSLTVTDVHVTKVTRTSVQLSWSNRTVDKLTAAYSVSYTDKFLAAHPGGINITNLQPSRNYSFEIFVIIPRELNYKEKSGPGVSISVQTLADETPEHVPGSATRVPLTTRSSEVIQTKSLSTSTESELCEFKFKDSNSISLTIFLLATISLSLLLVTSIVINIILMYKRRKKSFYIAFVIFCIS